MKILYFMNIDWEWIAQRPHYLAKELEKENDVFVYFPRYIVRKWKKQKGTPKTKNCHSIVQLPFQEYSSIIRFIEKKIVNFHIGDVSEFDVIWISSPQQIQYVPHDYKGKIIYDYMDDYVAMQKSEVIKRYTELEHNKTLKQANHVFVSSSLLEKQVQGKNDNITLLRNAVSDVCIYPPDKTEIKAMYRIGYFGTVSEWFDFPMLLSSLRKYSCLEYILWGPTTCSIPIDDHIIIGGTLEHKKMYDASKKISCLIMPFKINSITAAVDPVKLYEYISYGKCIISIKYPEIERFEEFVYFYSDAKEYVELLGNLIERGFPPKYNALQQRTFLNCNTWECRRKQISEVLNERENDS